MTEPLTSFPPVADPDARVLILGSMPGVESLRRGQYYAHPRNLFWDIMGDLFGAGRDLPYPARLQRLRTRRIALWDVVHQCRRQGSLDTAIDPASIRANDFPALFRECPGIEAVFFNGAKAREWFGRLVRPHLAVPLPALVQLPSTSPAHAAMSRRDKLARWRQIKERLDLPPA